MCCTAGHLTRTPTHHIACPVHPFATSVVLGSELEAGHGTAGYIYAGRSGQGRSCEGDGAAPLQAHSPGGRSGPGSQPASASTSSGRLSSALTGAAISASCGGGGMGGGGGGGGRDGIGGWTLGVNMWVDEQTLITRGLPVTVRGARARVYQRELHNTSTPLVLLSGVSEASQPASTPTHLLPAREPGAAANLDRRRPPVAGAVDQRWAGCLAGTPHPYPRLQPGDGGGGTQAPE